MPSIHIPPAWHLPERLATPESIYADRRSILKAMGFGALAMAIPPIACAAPQEGGGAAGREEMLAPAVGEHYKDRFPAKRNPAFTHGDRPLTAEEVAGRYNNFYEFTTDKGRVWRLARGYQADPWKVEVGGLVKKPRTLDLDDFFTRFPLEERLYRFRCVEAWAMQVPWTGFPLRALIDDLEPLSTAKYVRFESVLNPGNLPGQRSSGWYQWPYYEGLRLDEARNEVAFVVVGSYGHALPVQHGAPWRLALPWKYGFKGPKSVVKIEFTAEQPKTFWNESQPREYGFYANVEPEKPHPRWSQASERDIGTGERRPTLLYNGYAEQVGALYTGKEI